MNWKRDLIRLLMAYFGDQSVADGVAEMVLLSSDAPEHHEHWLATIDAALNAAKLEDPMVVVVINEALPDCVGSTSQASEFLSELRTAYVRLYEQRRGMRP